MRCTDPCADKGMTMTRRLQEADVVRNYEGVELQGRICMLQARKGKINNFYAQTTWRHEARMEITIGLHHWAEKERR